MSTIFWVLIAIGGLILFGVLLLIVLALVGFTSTEVQSAGVPVRLILPFLG